MQNCFNIQRAFAQKITRKWDKLYWCVDLHDCIIEGKYNKYNEGARFYPGAIDVLKWLTEQPDQVLILWSSSYLDSLEPVLLWLSASGVKFNYINENPECPSTELCDFSKKLYFNVLLDDKAGFMGETDWLVIKQILQDVGGFPV